MRFFNYSFLTMIFIISFTSIHAFAGSTSATMNIMATFSGLTCNITVDPTYNLGPLYAGNELKHPPLEIKWSCSDQAAVPTALKASVVQGGLSTSQTVIEMISESDGQKNGTLLWLEKSNGSAIKLSGDDKDYFCYSSVPNQQNTCKLTPVTKVNASDRIGPVKAAIRFVMTYP